MMAFKVLFLGPPNQFSVGSLGSPSVWFMSLRGWQGPSANKNLAWTTNTWLQTRGVLPLTGNSKFKVWEVMDKSGWLELVKPSLFNYREGVPPPCPWRLGGERAPGVLLAINSIFFEELQTDRLTICIYIKSFWIPRTNFIYKFCRKGNSLQFLTQVLEMTGFTWLLKSVEHMVPFKGGQPSKRCNQNVLGLGEHLDFN